MFMAGVVGVPVFFILMLTIGTSQDTFSDVGSIVEQVATYQFVGMFSPSDPLALELLLTAPLPRLSALAGARAQC
jgi:hypothetical protein